jgi:SAM-dependent methyltransferase
LLSAVQLSLEPAGPIAQDAGMSNDVETMRREVLETYLTPQAVAYYSARADEGLRTWEEAVVRRHFPSAGSVLIVGCGAGREMFALESRGFEVQAVEISPPLAEAARRNAVVLGSRATIHLTDGQALPGDDRAFDVVTLWSQVLAYVPTAGERARFLGEVGRVLRPGGVLSLSVHDAELTLAELAPERLLARDDPEPGDVRILEQQEQAVCTMHYFREPEVRALLEAAGFNVDLLTHTSDLGERWGNVFVVAATKR